MTEVSPSLSPKFAVLTRSGSGKTARPARAGDERDEPLRLPDRSSTALLERQEARTKPPPLYQVLLLNDDFTPMEFVVVVLQKFFMMDLEKATQVMLRVHREGRGVCGVYTRDIAATKVELVSSFARMHQHPLQCVMEEA
ncbi:MAG: ATP-dependent Clp protease adapter ClpS [Betaproteobacteria bacterium]|nr:ATP-dependent Clp protease adapter ClpS [Betaproteobacteria bacterium]